MRFSAPMHYDPTPPNEHPSRRAPSPVPAPAPLSRMLDLPQLIDDLPGSVLADLLDVPL